MDAAVESSRNANGNPAEASKIPRRYTGQGGVQDHPQTCTSLLPADDEWSRDTVLREVVADALQRNGMVVDEDTLEATITSFGSSDGALASAAPSGLQSYLVVYATQWSAQRDAQPAAPVDGALTKLKGLARKGATRGL